MAEAVSSIEVFEEFEGTGENRKRVGLTKKVRFWDKISALDKLLKHLGGYERKVRLPAPDDSLRGRADQTIAALFADDLSSEVATAVVQALAAHARIVETHDLATRVAALEAARKP